MTGKLGAAPPKYDQHFFQELIRKLDTMNDAKQGHKNDIIINDERYLMIRSPNGHYWAISVSDAGVVSAVDKGTTP